MIRKKVFCLLFAIVLKPLMSINIKNSIKHVHDLYKALYIYSAVSEILVHSIKGRRTPN